MENPENIFPILIILILTFFMALRIQAFLVKRAVAQVIDRFRKSNTLCPHNYKTIEELGLQPPTFFERFFKPRDYKPYALQLLKQAGAVRVTSDHKMCLRETELQHIQQSFGIE